MTVHFAGFESKRILGHYYSTVRSSRYCFRLMLWKSYNSDGNWWIIVATCYSFSLSLNMSFLEGKKAERWGTVAQNRLMKSQSYSQISWEVFFLLSEFWMDTDFTELRALSESKEAASPCLERKIWFSLSSKCDLAYLKIIQKFDFH